MRRLFLMFVFVLFTTTVSAQSFNFAGIEWGTPADAVVKALSSKGFTKITKDKDGDYSFEGELLGYKSLGFALMSKDGLVKVIVRLVTPDHKARAAYSEMKGTLTKKYGKPTSYEFFAKPYYEGDGFEEQAIRLGKGTFSSFWQDELTKAALSLEISERLTVDVTYESPFWSAESKKRKDAATSVF